MKGLIATTFSTFLLLTWSAHAQESAAGTKSKDPTATFRLPELNDPELRCPEARAMLEDVTASYLRCLADDLAGKLQAGKAAPNEAASCQLRLMAEQGFAYAEVNLACDHACWRAEWSYAEARASKVFQDAGKLPGAKPGEYAREVASTRASVETECKKPRTEFPPWRRQAVAVRAAERYSQDRSGRERRVVGDPCVLHDDAGYRDGVYRHPEGDPESTPTWTCVAKPLATPWTP